MTENPYKNEGQKWIAARLKDFGFYPEFAFDQRKYFKALTSHLGARKSEVFLDKIDAIISEQNPLQEMQIASLAKADQKLLKMIYSPGILPSIIILDRIMDIIDDMALEPRHIVDFGGANGWSLKLLKEFLESDIEMTLVEQNATWGRADEEIQCHFESYEEASIIKKADLGISIFGVPHIIINQLTNCVNRNLNESSVFITGLRIGDNKDFVHFLRLMEESSFFLNRDFSSRIEIDFDKFPIMVFDKSKGQAWKNPSLHDLKISE